MYVLEWFKWPVDYEGLFIDWQIRDFFSKHEWRGKRNIIKTFAKLIHTD